MRTLAVVAAGCILVPWVAVVSLAQGKGNLMKNSDFERFAGDEPVGWATTNIPKMCTVVTPSARAHGGKLAVKLEVKDCFGSKVPGMITQKNVRISGGDYKMTLFFLMKSVGGGRRVHQHGHSMKFFVKVHRGTRIFVRGRCLARMSLYAADVFSLDLPRRDKRLLVIAETDGCFADGVEAATGCTVGHRTLRIEDYGKVAATFTDVPSGMSLHIVPRLDIRERAFDFAPGENRRYFAQLHAYQVMPYDDLLSMEWVELKKPVEEILSRPGVHVNCDRCGEEILHEREVRRGDLVLCLACAETAYYSAVLVPGLDEITMSAILKRADETAV